MLIVKCIDDSNTQALREGEMYYAFPLNELKQAAYISRFPSKNAHTGCFQLNRFVEVKQATKAEKVHEIHYKSLANKEKYVFYGFEVYDIYYALYKNQELTDFFACVHKKTCELKEVIKEKTSFNEFYAFPRSITLGDLEDVQTVKEKTEFSKEFEQMTLF